MSHNENTGLKSDFRNISTFTFGSCPRSYDSVVRILHTSFKRGVICCGCGLL